jgi:hypothetical protein
MGDKLSEMNVNVGFGVFPCVSRGSCLLAVTQLIGKQLPMLQNIVAVHAVTEFAKSRKVGGSILDGIIKIFL